MRLLAGTGILTAAPPLLGVSDKLLRLTSKAMMLSAGASPMRTCVLFAVAVPGVGVGLAESPLPPPPQPMARNRPAIRVRARPALPADFTLLFCTANIPNLLEFLKLGIQSRKALVLLAQIPPPMHRRTLLVL